MIRLERYPETMEELQVALEWAIALKICYTEAVTLQNLAAIY
ncbi:hypothetical protein [Trichocoleus sp. FACHB-262]|nr:hypothetical protein [Trichocoleus sp. FACHB-262]